MLIKVYVCSPYRGDVKGNEEKARAYCKFAAKKGVLPIAPHLLFMQFIDDNKQDERELGLSFGLALLAMCDELWVFGDAITEGMAMEISEAERLGIKVKEVHEDV